jgi:3-hydroxyisobutyrate dehydrogenase
MVLGQEEGILQHMKEGSVLVDHTTSSPKLAMKIAEEAQKRNIGSVDAPVSGGDVGAKNGSVVVMAGGQAEAIEKARPFMDVYSCNIQNMGLPGAGQNTKAVNQIMIASTMMANAEAFIFAQKSGLDLHQMIQLLSKGAAGSKSLDLYGER